MKQYAVKAVTYYGKRVYSEPFNGLEQAEQKAEYYKQRNIFASVKVVERDVTHWKEVKHEKE